MKAGDLKASTDGHSPLDAILPGRKAFGIWQRYPDLFPSTCHVQMAQILKDPTLAHVDYAPYPYRRIARS